MTNTYALNVTRKQEFRVADDLRGMGLKPWVPLRLENTYVRELRRFKWYDVPYIPKLMFCVIPAVYFRDVKKHKHVIGDPLELTRRDIEGRDTIGLEHFKAMVEAEYADMKRKQANSEYECKFTPGQALKIFDGPFEGFDAAFKGIIHRAHDEYSKVRVEVEIFGRPTQLEIDPDKIGVE